MGVANEGLDFNKIHYWIIAFRGQGILPHILLLLLFIVLILANKYLMTTKIDIIDSIFDLFEVYGKENKLTKFIESNVLPLVNFELTEADTIGIGKRFSDLLNRVRSAATQAGSDRVHNVTEMLKTALQQYIKSSNDILTARGIFSRSIHKGLDMMVIVTAALILANALSKQHPQESISLVKGIAQKLSGDQNGKGIAAQASEMIGENASGSATSVGAIATVPMRNKKIIKRRKDSIFAENSATEEQIDEEDKMINFTLIVHDPVADSNELQFSDLMDNPEIPVMDQIQDIRIGGIPHQCQGMMVDPNTAELISAAHNSLNFENRQIFAKKSIKEMTKTARRLVESGFLKISFEEN